MSILNDTEQQALRDALDDEYRAWATYDQVIRDFGPERRERRALREADAKHESSGHPRGVWQPAARLARAPSACVSSLRDPVLGRGYMRVTTALPEDNQRFVAVLAEVLGRGEDRPI